MLSLQDLIREVSSIKLSSDQLSEMVAGANINLAKQASVITNLVKGSRTGQDAVMALSAATRSLAEAAVSMRTLSRTGEECIEHLSR